MTLSRFSFKIDLIYSVFVAVIFMLNINCQENEPITQKLSPSENKPSELFLPVEGCVPDEETACNIAEAVWLPIYGEAIYRQKPFQVELINDSIWVVCGILPSEYNKGGVAYLELRKDNGKILGIGHGK